TVVEPSDQRVLLVDLEVKARVSIAIRVGRDERVVDDHWLQRHRIECGCIHYGISIADVSSEVSRERRSFRNYWTTQTAAVAALLIRRANTRKRIARVERFVGEVITETAVPLVGARLREDLDAAETRKLVLRRKRIVVDAYFADGFFRRYLTVGETVDFDL